MLLSPVHVLGRKSKTPSFSLLFAVYGTTSSLRDLETEEEEQLYAKQLRKCVESSNLHHGGAIHAKLIKAKPSLSSSLYLHNQILNAYIKCGHLSRALKLFDQIPQRNVVTWSALISGLVQHGCSSKALSLFSRMHSNAKSAVSPNEFTLVSVLHACSLSHNLFHLYQTYAYIVRLGFQSSVFLMNALLTALIRHEKFLEAKEVFDEFQNKDIVSWNAMMAGLMQHSCLQIPSFWLRMSCSEEGVKPDHFSFATLFTGLAALSDHFSDYMGLGLQAHAQLVKSGYGDEICVGNSLCHMYIKNQKLMDGFRAFHEMPCKDVRSWTEVAAGSLQCGEPREALQLIEEMREMGVKPNKFTIATALNACANLASLEEGMKFHGLRIKLGSQVDVCVDNALLDMYAKSGCLDGAWVVFRSISDHDLSVVSWTTMIMGCAQNGQAREALEIFDEMIMKAMEPNYITFICVLYACGQGGFVDQGWKYFSSMFSDHGISPGEDHYACMVRLLGRAGRIKEAEELILRMPFQPGVLVWQTLLGASQLHGDMETGKRAAQHAMDLNGKDPSTYILLSNMFAGLKNWDSVGMLRKLMENREVKKMTGSSWIEVEKFHSVSPACIVGYSHK